MCCFLNQDQFVSINISSFVFFGIFSWLLSLIVTTSETDCLQKFCLRNDLLYVDTDDTTL